MFYVYLMKAGDKHYKVGMTKDLVKRVKGIQTSNPNKIELVSSKLVELPRSTEMELHKKLKLMSSGGGTEWFTLEPKAVIDLCIDIQKYPHIELSEKVIIRDLLQRQLMWKKTVEKKLDIILNNYQKGVVKTLGSKNDKPSENGVVANILEREMQKKQDQEEKQDELYEQALATIKLAHKASTSLLQRKMRIGYGRAARLIENLEENGVISVADGSRPRSVLIE